VDAAGARGRWRFGLGAHALLGLAIVAALLAALWGVRAERAPLPAAGTREDGLLVRRDAVRALAAERGLPNGDGAGAPAPAAPR
jgi:hypothetical protein